jgi:membrane-bound inhibitor of C-type lysozyme
MLAVLAQPAAFASNTAPSRSFTSEWTCENGRAVLVNAHPRRPREVASITYAGNRFVVHPAPAAAGVRYASSDGGLVWHRQGAEAILEYPSQLERPIRCTLKTSKKE